MCEQYKRRYLHGEGSHNRYIFGARAGNDALNTKCMLSTGFMQEKDIFLSGENPLLF